MKKRAIVLSRRVESRILVLRGHRVILDADLAELYGVEVKRLNQQVVAKLTELECRLESHDADIQDLVEAIRELMAPPPPNGRRIGFDYTSSSAKLHGKAHGSWRQPRTTSRISSSKTTSALIPSL